VTFFACFELQIHFGFVLPFAYRVMVLYQIVSLVLSWAFYLCVVACMVTLFSDLPCLYNLDMSAIFMFK
jgi:hypothetical protein